IGLGVLSAPGRALHTDLLLLSLFIAEVLCGSSKELWFQSWREAQSSDALDFLHEFSESDEAADFRQRLFTVGERRSGDLLTHLGSTLVRCNEVQRQIEIRLESQQIA